MQELCCTSPFLAYFFLQNKRRLFARQKDADFENISTNKTQPKTLVQHSYVSFAEIFTAKAVEGFEEGGYKDGEAYAYATMTFFAGILFTYVARPFAKRRNVQQTLC